MTIVVPIRSTYGNVARGDAVAACDHFRTAAAGFGASGQPLDEARCSALAAIDARIDGVIAVVRLLVKEGVQALEREDDGAQHGEPRRTRGPSVR